MRNGSKCFLATLFVLLFIGLALPLRASTSNEAEDALRKVLMGKDVRALLDMPAYKDGIDLYAYPKDNSRFDERGIDLKELAKYLKDKGVGVARDEWVTITDVKFDTDRVEIHLGGGGEGRGASKNAEKKGAGLMRAGGSRINFRYGKDLADSDIQIDTFLSLLGRVLDTSRIRAELDAQKLPPQFKDAIQAKSIIVGMTYEMVLLSSGQPDEKKVEDSTDSSLHETWYFMKDGHRWVVRFLNGKVEKVQVY